MEESKKKPIMIAVIVVCLVIAGAVAYMNRSGGDLGIGAYKGELMWVKCSNPDCGAEYQMDMADYFTFMKENRDAWVTAAVPMVCKKCGEESVYEAIGCKKCGFVFYPGQAETEYVDMCPKCGYSEIKEKTEQARREE